VPRRASRLLLAAALPLLSCATPAPHLRAVEQVRRGYQHLAAGDLERAEVAFEHALEVAPDLAEARSGLGVALRTAGRTSEALVQFDLALTADPDLAEAHVNRGEALAALGFPVEADRAFAAALRIDPDQVPARIDRARLLARRGAAAGGEERTLLLLRARRDLLHALEARPDLALAHHDLGWVAWLRGDLAGAAASYERAVGLDPELVEARLGACAARAIGGPCGEGAASCRRCVGAASPGSPASLRCSALLDAVVGCSAGTPVTGRREEGAPARASAPHP
jgi:tetratricopeptide (TPR) repeat protein